MTKEVISNLLLLLKNSYLYQTLLILRINKTLVKVFSMYGERLHGVSRYVAVGALVAASYGLVSENSFAGGGCNVPPAPTEGPTCTADRDLGDYSTYFYKISWKRDNLFRVESATHFLGLGFLWETSDGSEAGKARLVQLCGKTTSETSINAPWKSIVDVTVDNPLAGCLLRRHVGGGGG